MVVNMTRWASHPWSMIEDKMIWTLDAKDIGNPNGAIKLFPNERWLRELTDLWLREPLLAVRKSRQMLCSWLFCYLALWQAVFHQGAACYLQSDKEDKSDELVDRCAFMFNQIPDSEMLKPKLKGNRKMYCSMEWPALYSKIKGIPQGADALRQFAATLVVMDEVGFWEKAAESFGATKPTADGGGKIVMISSANSGFFRNACFDLTL